MQFMRTALAGALLAVAVAAPSRTFAQDAGDIAAYAALSFTPLGAFVPLPPPPSGIHGNAFVLRYGSIDIGGELASPLHHFSIGGDFATGRGRIGLTIGGTTCEDCDGSIMAGLDYTVPLTRNVLSVALRPAFGFSKPLEDEGTALSFGVSLPLGLELSGSTGPSFIPYLVPGIGFGRVSGDEDSERGMRPMLGGGFAIAGRVSGRGPPWLSEGLHRRRRDGLRRGILRWAEGALNARLSNPVGELRRERHDTREGPRAIV